MNYARALMMVFILASSIQRLEAQMAIGKRPVPRAKSQVNERSLVHYLQLALASTGYSARLYFQGTCGTRDSLQFPSIDILPPTHGSTGVQAVREIFRNDKDVVVSADTPGLIRITKGLFSSQSLT